MNTNATTPRGGTSNILDPIRAKIIGDIHIRENERERREKEILSAISGTTN
mgnify:CR=1 FL=1